MSTEEMSVEEAIDVVVQHARAAALEDALAWEDYPEIGEFDWDEIIGRASSPYPEHEKFLEAYKLLAARATKLGTAVFDV
jgi:hypothetical protein